MKESVTKFDLEMAFKALDQIEMPKTRGGLKANRVNLHEQLNKKLCTDVLMEEYYDIMNTEELEQAEQDRENDVAAAKLAKIEKIVDLDAESLEDIQPSYVGKIIIQCPQCMTLFYKNKEDLVPSEDDPSTVNVGEACQHCNNVDGYSVIGKVAEEEVEPEAATEEEPVEEPAENEEAVEEPAEEESAEELPELEEVPVEEQTEEEEPKQESLNRSRFPNKKNTSEWDSENLTLNESAEEDNAKEATMEMPSKAEIDELFNSDEFKKKITDAETERYLDAMDSKNESIHRSRFPNKKNTSEHDSENLTLNEEKEEEEEEKVSDEELNAIMADNKKDIDKCIKNLDKVQDILTDMSAKLGGEDEPEEDEEAEEPSEKIVDDMVADLEDTDDNEAEAEDGFVPIDEFADLEEVEDVDEALLNRFIGKSLTENYKNIKSFETTSCTSKDGKFIVEGKIKFKSGKAKTISYIFERALAANNRIIMEGYCNEIAAGNKSAFQLIAKNTDKVLLAESFDYNYKVGNKTISNVKKN